MSSRCRNRIPVTGQVRFPVIVQEDLRVCCWDKKSVARQSQRWLNCIFKLTSRGLVRLERGCATFRHKWHKTLCVFPSGKSIETFNERVERHMSAYRYQCVTYTAHRQVSTWQDCAGRVNYSQINCMIVFIMYSCRQKCLKASFEDPESQSRPTLRRSYQVPCQVEQLHFSCKGSNDNPPGPIPVLPYNLDIRCGTSGAKT